MRKSAFLSALIFLIAFVLYGCVFEINKDNSASLSSVADFESSSKQAQTSEVSEDSEDKVSAVSEESESEYSSEAEASAGETEDTEDISEEGSEADICITEGHDFAEANCTEPKRCKICGITEGEALGHDADSADCENASYCKRCGKKISAALGHDYAKADCINPAKCKRCGITKGEALGHEYSGGKCKRCGLPGGALTVEEAKLFKNKLTDEQNAEALAVARSIAEQVAKTKIPDNYAGEEDLFKVGTAAAIVSDYCQNRCVYTTVGINYSQAYGVFVVGEYSCAGATRALGLVLSCMGYEWEHVNPNQWTHQWVRVVMDGQEGFADGQIGWVGYGEHPPLENFI